MTPSEKYIPTHLLRPLVMEWERKRRLSNGTECGYKALGPRVILAELSGVNERTIQAIVNGERETVQFRIADRLITAMDQPEAWQFELAEA